MAGGLSLVSQAQFVLNGDAFDLGDGCFQLTEEINNQAGSVWYDSLINLEDFFEVNFQINLGDIDESGADGEAAVAMGWVGSLRERARR